MPDFLLTPAQEAAVRHRGGPLLIAAGAGSGKTRVLVERLLDRVCRDGLDIDRFLVITYTRAAAAELRSRVLEGLSARLAETPEDKRLRRQTALVYRAQIGTIHSFCAALLREHAYLCGVRPDFRQLDAGEEAVLRAEVLDETLRARYAALTPAFSALVDTLGAGRDDAALKTIVLDCYAAVQSHPSPEAWLRARLDAPLPLGDVGDTPWGSLLLARARAGALYWRGRMEEARVSLGEASALESAYAASFEATLLSLDGYLQALEAGWDAAAAFPGVEFPKLKPLRGMGEHPTAQRVKALRSRCKAGLAKQAAVFDAPSEAHIADMAFLKPVTDALFSLVLDFAKAYAQEKNRRAALDFGDLEHLALGLLTAADTGAPTAQAREVARRYEEILVDEYQDCNRVQDRIFTAISRDGQNVTMVGDVKQSIYRFRLADPSIFLEKYARYADAPAPGQGRRVILAENFRSDAGILRVVNDAFSRLMSKALGELDYGPLEELRPGPLNPRAEAPVCLRLLEYGEGQRLEMEAEAAAAEVEALLNSGMTVPDGAGLRPLEAGDIAILLRASRGKDEAYIAALERRGIAACAPRGGSSLVRRREVGWAMALLQTIDNPRQDVPLIAALRSPVWGYDAEMLARVRCAAPSGSFYEALRAHAEGDARSRAVLAQLSDLRFAACELPAHRLLAYLYEKTSLPALAEAREKGSSANLSLLLDYAVSCGQAGCRGLFGFINQLLESDGPAAGAGRGGGVAVSTMHAAKGLEYPVVILADLAKRFNKSDSRKSLLLHPDLGVGPKRADRERGIEYPSLARMALAAKIDNETLSEELRILYVAMTRPKQKLIVFLSVKDTEKTLKALSAGVDAGAAKLEPQFLEDCQSPAEWLLAVSLSLRGAGAWALTLPRITQAAQAAPAREEESGEEDCEALAEEIRAGLRWRYSRAEDALLPSKLTATELKGGFAQAEAAEEAEDLPSPDPWTGETARASAGAPLFSPEDFPLPTLSAAQSPPGAAERGSALHLAVQHIALERCATEAEAAAALGELLDRRLLTPRQHEAVAPAALVRLRGSPLGKELLSAAGLRREFKFSLLVPAARFLGEGKGEVLLQGVVDCWWETPAGICLADFKSDRVSRASQGARAAGYAPQLEAYAYALEAITGRRVVRKCIYFFATGDTVEL